MKRLNRKQDHTYAEAQKFCSFIYLQKFQAGTFISQAFSEHHLPEHVLAPAYESNCCPQIV